MKNKIGDKIGDKIFDIINILLFLIFSVVILVPVIYVLKTSFDAGSQGELSLSLIPRQFSLLYYKIVLSDSGIYRPFINSAFITVIGTLVSILLESLGAYTLSKKSLPGNKIFVYMIVITMMFSGGLIPFYLVVKNIGLIDKLAALIIPTCISGWNMMLIRNYYWSIPESLSESAKVDGASEFTIFSRIIFPLSVPVMAAIGLFTAVGYWNTFFNAIIFINTPTKYTFPVKLREMIIQQEDMIDKFQQAASSGNIALKNLNQQGVSSAMIILSTIPILIIYPYLQKYFVKGIMVGAIKG